MINGEVSNVTNYEFQSDLLLISQLDGMRTV